MSEHSYVGLEYVKGVLCEPANPPVEAKPS